MYANLTENGVLHFLIPKFWTKSLRVFDGRNPESHPLRKPMRLCIRSIGPLVRRRPDSSFKHPLVITNLAMESMISMENQFLQLSHVQNCRQLILVFGGIYSLKNWMASRARKLFTSFAQAHVRASFAQARNHVDNWNRNEWIYNEKGYTT